jgi:predicted aspartyl protease
MIHGLVNARHEAVVRLRFRGPGGFESVADAIVDTGCTFSLTLPATLAATLGLIRQSSGTATLADGSVHQLDVYAVDVEWDGVWRPTLAWAVGNEVLVGMRLLARHTLRIDAVPAGTVEISPLP